MSPSCPKCGGDMYVGTNRKEGSKGFGRKFWGCRNYSTTGCKGSLPYIEDEEFPAIPQQLPTQGKLKQLTGTELRQVVSAAQAEHRCPLCQSILYG